MLGYNFLNIMLRLQYSHLATRATGNMRNGHQAQLATRAKGDTGNWQRLQLATRATGNTCNWQHVQLITCATGSFTSCALRNRSSECQSCRRVMLLRLPAHLRKHPGSEGQGRPQEGQGHSALLPKGGGQGLRHHQHLRLPGAPHRALTRASLRHIL